MIEYIFGIVYVVPIDLCLVFQVVITRLLGCIFRKPFVLFPLIKVTAKLKQNNRGNHFV